MIVTSPSPAPLRAQDQRAALHDEAHVYLACVDEYTESARWADCAALLCQEEQERMSRFVFEKDRRLYAAAHALVRRALSRYADVPVVAWRFARGAFGRPEISIPAGLPLRFNLSHTRGLCACVVTRTIACGVDVEQARPLDDLLGLAQSSLSAREYAALLDAEGSQQKDRFYRYWTLKEAYIKARGLGLSLPLRSFSFLFEGGEAIQLALDNEAQVRASDWQFHHRRVGPEYHLSVALERGAGPDRRVVVRWTDPTRVS